MNWQNVKLDESNFEFITQAMEYELTGIHDENIWNCELIFYKDAQPNKMSTGTKVASFTAETPEKAKELANKKISQPIK